MGTKSAKIGKKLKTICCLSLLLLSGCKTLNNAPISHLYVVDLDNGVCSKRIITNKTTLASKRVADLPLSECDGIIGLDAQEFSNLRTYLKGDNNAQ